MNSGLNALKLVRSVKQERKEEMMRKLAVALSLASVLGAGVVQALGLGEASVESTLNQPLKAEIELVNIRDLEDNEILPGLASREEFLKAGVERIYFLSDVRFEVKRNESGKMVVELTTNKPVREPFLNFLVEVIWPSGRLLREYALLIDPPIYAQEPVAPVRQVESTPTTTFSQLPEIDVIDEAPASQTVSAPAAQQAPVAENTQQQGDVYGPTNNSDTMWAIALKVRPDSSVTAQQTMLAIQDLNPNSFIDGNINSLKKGQILRLPSLNDIRQRSKREAVRGVIAQNRDFEKRALGKNVVDATPAIEESGSTPVSAPVKTGDELKLVVAENTASDNEAGAHAGEAASDGSADALKNNLAITLEKLDQTNLEKEELNSRVKDLEEQLETLQRLLTLKDDQLANLQTQMGQEEAPAQDELAQAAMEGAATTEQAPTDAMAAEEGMTDSETVSAESDLAVQDSEVATDEMVATEADGVEEVAQASDMSASETAVKSTDTAKPVDTAKPADAATETKAKSAPIAATEPAKEDLSVQSIVDMIMKNPMYQLVAGGVVILLLLIVWGLSRRNAQKEQEFFETRNEDGEEPGDIFDVEQAEGGEASDDTIVAAEDHATEDDTELTSQPETEDVIAEADIYIAYGRLDQAAQLLENAISSEPQRTDTRLKLLEVYAESNEIESFDKQYNEVQALNDDYALEQANEIKSRLSESDDMVSIDDLESQLLAGDSEPALGEPEPVLDESEQVAEEPEDKKDEIITIDYEPTTVPTSQAEESNVDDLNIDEELSSLESDLAADGVDQSAIEAEDDNLDIDFDINEIDLELDESATDEPESIEFNLESETVDTLEAADSALEDEMDLDLGIDESEQDTTEKESDAGEADLELDDLALSEEFANLDADEAGSDLTDIDAELTDIDSDLADIDSELSDLDSELDEIALDLDAKSEETEASQISEELSGDELEGELNLDDLDLELDKIDSELDGNFDLDDSLELSESLPEEDSSELLSSDAAVEELEEIAETLSADVVEPTENADEPAFETDELSVAEDLDDQSGESLELDENLEAELDGAVETESTSNEIEDDGLDIDDSILDLKESVADESGFESDISDDDDFDFLEGTDEAATKLDLARAYIDMGDGDGAKDILEEVALEGSEAQKQEAQDLLKTLD